MVSQSASGCCFGSDNSGASSAGPSLYSSKQGSPAPKVSATPPVPGRGRVPSPAESFRSHFFVAPLTAPLRSGSEYLSVSPPESPRSRLVAADAPTIAAASRRVTRSVDAFFREEVSLSTAPRAHVGAVHPPAAAEAFKAGKGGVTAGLILGAKNDSAFVPAAQARSVDDCDRRISVTRSGDSRDGGLEQSNEPVASVSIEAIATHPYRLRFINDEIEAM